MIYYYFFFAYAEKFWALDHAGPVGIHHYHKAVFIGKRLCPLAGNKLVVSVFFCLFEYSLHCLLIVVYHDIRLLVVGSAQAHYAKRGSKTVHIRVGMTHDKYPL